MAHIADLWERAVDGHRVRTDRYGKGRRWLARYEAPDGRSKSKTFARKLDAERFLATVETDKLRGTYLDPDAGRVGFGDFADAWLDSQTFDPSSREAVASRLRAHIRPAFGGYELREIRPSQIQSWLRGLQRTHAPTYVRVMLANLSAILSAAVEDGLIPRNPCSARGAVKPPALVQRKVIPGPPIGFTPWSAPCRSGTDPSPSSPQDAGYGKGRCSGSPRMRLILYGDASWSASRSRSSRAGSS